MLLLKIAGLIIAICVGVWLGFKMVGVIIAWLKYGLKSIKPPRD